MIGEKNLFLQYVFTNIIKINVDVVSEQSSH